MDRFRIHSPSLVPLLLMVLIVAGSAPGAVIYVDDSAPPDGDGTTWNTAYDDLQAALAMAVSGDEIRVGGGTYRPVPVGGSPYASFRLVNGVSILGGYAGYGLPHPDLRDASLYRTILRGNDSQFVVVAEGVDATTILEGVTITGGVAYESDGSTGGGAGLRIINSSPTIKNCIVTQNRARNRNPGDQRYGAGVYILDGDPVFTDCLISDNSHQQWWPGSHGGGIAISGGAPAFFNCIIRDNRAGEGLWGPGGPPQSGDSGGGVYCIEGADPSFVNCKFLSNLAGPGGFPDESDGADGGHGGGLYFATGTHARLINCVIAGNRAGDGSYSSGILNIPGDGGHGGGIYIAGGASASANLINCIFQDNEAGIGGSDPSAIHAGTGGSGGAIYTASWMEVRNCTFTGNKAGRGGSSAHHGQGGAVYRQAGSVTIYNSIVWKNNGIRGATATTTETAGSITARYSCIRNWTAGGMGMITSDPLFVDEGGRDLHLSDLSPCIDAGNNGSVPPDYGDLNGNGDTSEPTPLDLDLDPRRLDNPFVPDSGSGTPPIVDMGVYESAGSDCNASGIADELEILAGSSQDCNGDVVPDECQPDEDCNANGVRDICDIGEGTSLDVNMDLVPDECQPDCNGNGVPDSHDLATGASSDCNLSGSPDECDVTSGASDDCDGGGVPDECQPDCNGNGVYDFCDISAGTSQDCDDNGHPEECERFRDCNDNAIQDSCDIRAGTSTDLDGDGIPDDCQMDCNSNGIPDAYEISTGIVFDCNGDSVPDDCDTSAGTSEDCNDNEVPDECEPDEDCNSNAVRDICDIGAGTSLDVDADNVPDECQLDCNLNNVPDSHELAEGSATDCNVNGLLDSCDIASGTAEDCNGNDLPDSCEAQEDCNSNGIQDICDIATGASADFDGDGTPDECQEDCNLNDIPDTLELLEGTAVDCNHNSILDDCDIAAGTASDCNSNNILDTCEPADAMLTSSKLVEAMVDEGDAFGSSLSFSNDRFIVGALLGDGIELNQGEGYIFHRGLRNWTLETQLYAADPVEGDRFGGATAIHNESAIVGAYLGDVSEEDGGAAYVFRHDAGSWMLEHVLVASDSEPFAQFGVSVDLEDDCAVVGAWRASGPFNLPDYGAAYVFRRTGSVWTQVAKLIASDGSIEDIFGYSVSLNGDVIVVGSRWDDDRGSKSGSAYVFRYNGTTWVQEAKLLAPDGAANDEFGWKVAILNDVIAVGARLHDSPNGTDSGAVYIYRHDGAQWQQETKLVAPDGAAGDQFGVSVDLDTDTLAVGAHLNDEAGSDAGAAYVFQHRGGKWIPIVTLVADDAAPDDQFGISVAIEDRTIVVGARYDDDQGADSGSVYVYEIAPTDPGDFDRDGDVDLADYAGMADCLGGPEAAPGPGDAACAQMCLDAFDLDDDGDIDLLDFAEFETEF